MWPSFSLCAWRILKIRSCFRNPLAPGKSKDRAILVSSVIFFSLSSAMVINHLREDFSKGGTQQRRIHRRGRGGGKISSPPLCLSGKFRLGQNRLPLRACNPVQDLVHGLLDSGIGLVKLSGSLRCKLTEHIPVAQSM